MVTAAPVDEARLNDFLGRMVCDLAAAANAPLMLLGDKLGLYKALAEAGALSSASPAEESGTAERYVGTRRAGSRPFLAKVP